MVDKKKWVYILPVTIFLYSVLVLKIKKIEFNFTGLNWIKDKEVFYDLFSFYKAQIIVFAAILAIAILIYDYVKSDEKIKVNYKSYLIFSIFAFFVILSFLFCEYKEIAKIGMFDRYESVFVSLSYVVMAAYILYILKNKKVELYLIIRIIIILGIILGVIGTLQYFKMDLFRMEWFKNVVVDSALGVNSQVNFAMPDGRVYLTVYNPNYVGVLMSMLIIVFLNVFILSENRMNKFLSLIGIPLMIISLLGSGSRSGMFALVIGIIVLIAINIKKMWKYKYLFIIMLLVIFGVVNFINEKTDGYVQKRFVSIFKIEKKEITGLQNIETRDERIIITYNDEKYSILKYKNSPIGLVLEKEKNIIPRYKDGSYYFNVDGIDKMTIQVGKYDEHSFWQFKIDKEKWNFIYTDKGMMYINNVGKLTSMKVAPNIKMLEGYEKLGSSRVYIWSRSLPLIKERMITGYGPDMYVIAFPQDDYIYKAKFFSNRNIVVDKPHNMYLQYLVNFGVPAFIFFLLILLNAIYIGFRNKEENEYLKSIAVSSIFVIATVMFFNDSTVSTSPLMWTLIGIGSSQV